MLERIEFSEICIPNFSANVTVQSSGPCHCYMSENFCGEAASHRLLGLDIHVRSDWVYPIREDNHPSRCLSHCRLSYASLQVLSPSFWNKVGILWHIVWRSHGQNRATVQLQAGTLVLSILLAQIVQK